MKRTIGFYEFIGLMAFVTCFMAMSIDIMLPALAVIGEDLQVENKNDTQFIVTFIFLGVSIGQVFYGPLSDFIGRRPAIFLGMGIFIIGTVLSFISTNLETMLIGRFLQGIGAAGPRIVTIAIVRDKYSGAEMAKVLSMIMSIFILIPILAPILGQWILQASDWRMLFLFLLAMSVLATMWFATRLNETLLVSNRCAFSRNVLWGSFKKVLLNEASKAYVISLGLVFGAFIGFLGTSQQLLQELYGLGDLYPYYFALLSIGIGFSYVLNAKLVSWLGIERLVLFTQALCSLISALFLVYLIASGVNPKLWQLMLYLGIVLMSVGLLFGNLNALAMQPFGNNAGMASGVVGASSTMLAVLFGSVVSQAFNESVLPLVLGYLILTSAALLVTVWGRKSQKKPGINE